MRWNPVQELNADCQRFSYGCWTKSDRYYMLLSLQMARLHVHHTKHIFMSRLSILQPS